MKASDAKKLLGIQEKTLLEQEHNPTELVEIEEFRKKHNPSAPGYRQRTIHRLTEAYVGFQSTANIIFDLAKSLLAVTCPHCKTPTQGTGGGGTPEAYSVDFQCQTCGTTVSLTFPSAGITIAPANRNSLLQIRESRIDNLLTSFSRIHCDGEDYVNITTEPASSHWSPETLEELGLAPDSIIVRLETDDKNGEPDLLYFEETELYKAKSTGNKLVDVKDTDGNLHTLEFFQEIETPLP